nr:alpha-amylase family protein [Jiangella mangrovi]
MWIAQWEKTAVQGVVVNAGGIVAYYPSRFPLHYRAQYLGGRDLFGEIVEAARERGLTVVARMDCNRADQRFYDEHPDWFCVDADGVPYTSTGRYHSCVNSPYYDTYIPQVLTEVIERYRPDGFADNNWSGLPRERICYCRNCAAGFRDAVGEALPANHDWDDPVYRRWIRWNYDRRIEIWDRFNEVTRSVGGPDCLWMGMNSPHVEHQSRRFRDLKRISDRTPYILLDHQYRQHLGFQENAHGGKLIRGLQGWRHVAAENTAMYNFQKPPFRTSAQAEPEARMWMVEGIAGGLHPWWHHIGAHSEDHRQYDIAAPTFTWHRDHEDLLTDRRPVANVGLVWSQDNTDFYGRDDPELRTQLPHFGVVDALVRAGIGYVPIHVSRLESQLDGIDVLVLASVGALSDDHCAAIRRFVQAGGGLVATGESSLYDEDGVRREDFGLADVFGASAKHAHLGAMRHPVTSWEAAPTHTYLHIPVRWDDEATTRHPVLDGFVRTNQLPFGGRVECVEATDAEALLTFVAPFPVVPPETSWQRFPATGVPCLLVRESGGRVAYFPADVDRCFGRGFQPDHAVLLANAVRWAAHGRQPVTISGVGTIDAHLYVRGDGSHVLHLVNLSGSGTWRAPMHEYIPVGPIHVELTAGASPGGAAPRIARLAVSGGEIEVSADGDVLALDVPRIVDHEVVVIPTG